MYAIVEIAGQQFKVAQDQRLYVHRLNANKGESVDFDSVLLVDNGGKVNVGAPVISGARVSAKVLGHLKGDKVIVFKKKRRKGYQKSNGHRQYLTQIQISGIAINGAKSTAKSEEPAKAEEKKEKPAPKAEVKTAPKTEAKAAPKAKKADDLKMIEGVGPKIAELMHDAGIVTFSDLAAASVEKLNEILSEAGGAYASHNPETWPAQAKMAAEGKFDELKKWQDELDGGIEK